MCAVPRTQLFRGHSKYIRITADEKRYLSSTLSEHPNLTLSDFLRWRKSNGAVK
jgi:hypothetical protein